MTAGLRRALPGPLLEEAMRAALGRMSCTASEMQAQGGPDAEAIRRTLRLEGARRLAPEPRVTYARAARTPTLRKVQVYTLYRHVGRRAAPTPAT